MTEEKIPKVEELNKFLRHVKRARSEIKYSRPNFWNKNRINFKNNIKTLVSFFPFPKAWKVDVIASKFLIDKPSMPYDLDVWSFSDVVSATEKQGFNIILFFNKTDLEFLSLPALLPIVVHEVAHVYQAANDTKKYVQAAVDDKMSIEYEEGADAEVKKYSEEFRRQNILEKIMYCYDIEGWNGAKKMVQYLHVEAQESFGGGYDQSMKEEEYKIFAKAEDEKDIDIFIDHFLESIEKELEKIEKS